MYKSKNVLEEKHLPCLNDGRSLKARHQE